MDPLTIIAIIAGVAVFLVVLSIILLLLRKRKAEFSSPVGHEGSKVKSDDENSMTYDKKSTFKDVCQNILVRIQTALNAMKINSNVDRLKSDLFGDNPEQNFSEDGTVVKEYKVEKMYSFSRGKNLPQLGITEPSTGNIIFSSVFKAGEQLPISEEELKQGIEVKKEGENIRVTVKSGPSFASVR